MAQVDYEAYVKGGKLTTSENKKKEKDLLTDTEFRWSNVQQVLWQGAPQPGFSTREASWVSGSDQWAWPIY